MSRPRQDRQKRLTAGPLFPLHTALRGQAGESLRLERTVGWFLNRHYGKFHGRQKNVLQSSSRTSHPSASRPFAIAHLARPPAQRVRHVPTDTHRHTRLLWDRLDSAAIET